MHGVASISPPTDDGRRPDQKRQSRIPFRLINDEPLRLPDQGSESDDDLLGTGEVAERLAGLLLDSRNATPFTLAIDAGWGMGKSSLMHQIERRMAAVPGIECIWFNAWTAHGADALEGLIKSVLLRFDRNALRRTLNRVRGHHGALRLLRTAVSLVFGFFQLGRVVDELWSWMEADAAARNVIRNSIKEAATEWATGSGSRPGGGRLLVVFVDDLDRCPEETVHAVLEAIKVYLDVPGVMFVLGCDEARLAAASGRGRRPAVGTEYLEKIVQAGYRIPPPSADQARDLVQGLARASGTEHLLVPPLDSLLAERTGRNPRRIKRLLNSFVMYELDPDWRNEFPPEAVIRTVLLHHLYPNFHRLMSRPENPDLVADFVRYHQARAVLRTARNVADDHSWHQLEELAAQLGVHPPDHSAPSTWSDCLKRLESALPEIFPQLAADPHFVTLITEIHDLPDSEKLRRRLKRTSANPTPPLGIPPQLPPPDTEPPGR